VQVSARDADEVLDFLLCGDVLQTSAAESCWKTREMPRGGRRPGGEYRKLVTSSRSVGRVRVA